MIVLGGFDLSITFLLPLKSKSKGPLQRDPEVPSVNSLQPRVRYIMSAIDHWMLRNVSREGLLVKGGSHSAVLVQFGFSQRKER